MTTPGPSTRARCWVSASASSRRVAGVLLLGLLALPAAAQGAVAFIYHHFGVADLPSTNVRLEQFDAQLEHLAEAGYQVWSLGRVVGALRAGEALPDRVVSLTADDAYRSVYEEAWPRLKRRGWPLTVFVPTDPVDDGVAAYMSWDQMRELAAQGVEFANHSASHDHLLRRSGESAGQWRQRVRSDLERAGRRLREELGPEALASPALLAYPYGEYSLELAELVRGMGYVGVGQQSGAMGPGADLGALPRFPVNERYGALDSFSTKAASLALPVVMARPREPVRPDGRAPALELELGGVPDRLDRLACYFGGERLELESLGERRFRVAAGGALQARRGRYNCTVPGPEGRYFWYSHLWIDPAAPE